MATLAPCAVVECERPQRTRGWCTTHYARWRRNGHPGLQPKIVSVCSVGGCGQRVIARGWCSKHYQRWEDNGDPLVGARKSIVGLTCEVDTCERPARTRELCGMHYRRLWKLGHTGLKEGCAVDPTCTRCGRQRTRNPAGRYVCRPCKAAYLRTYYAANVDHLRADARIRGLDPRAKERHRRYREANPAIFIAATHRRRARKRQAVCEHGDRCVTADALNALRAMPCRYCGAPSEHADHYIPLVRGGLHCRDNLVPACAPCNLSKGPKTLDEWLSSATFAQSPKES